ncbi:hypothetical protein ACFPIJ_11605 [Dactylosporangium cerinum]|uniref:Uncharacterized protein n=1 Tax=Dactylosporangium cerinum TaxID=1434730 RepID=A0ABV9VRZ4_9ACTN
MTDAAGRQDGAGEFWETEPGWVLVNSSDGGYLPVNQITSKAMLVCDESESARITAGMRLSGCPVLDMPHGANLPIIADIYVDRVPQDGLQILIELRRLLGMVWPFSDLRNLLARQPIRARAGDVAEMRSALTAIPHLRPHLFHDAHGSLEPVWPDD